MLILTNIKEHIASFLSSKKSSLPLPKSKMNTTIYYTFLPTKYQEENIDSNEVQFSLLPHEIEIRPITYIIITLTTEELQTSGKILIPFDKLQDILLCLPADVVSCLSSSDYDFFYISVDAKDLDTNTIHRVTLSKYVHDDHFVMSESWIEEFVMRRRLEIGMVVSFYWEAEAKMFYFYVVEGNE